MMERLVLKDGGQVADQDREFCKELQKTLEAERKNGSIVLPKDWFPNRTHHRIGKLKVFAHFQLKYCAQCFTGFLNFKGRQVLIHSRFDHTGALTRYMMTRLGLMPRMLWNHTTQAESSSFQIPMVYTFLRQVKEACAMGVYRQYETFSYNNSHPKGALNIPMHIRKNPINNGRIAYTTREYTADNPINRLILATWQYLERDTQLGPIAHKIVREHPEMLTPIKNLGYQLNSPYVDQRQLARIMRQASSPITHHMHTRYEQVRKTSLTILKNLGYEPNGETGSGRLAGMLFPMDIMWEYFLEESILKGMSFDAQSSIGIFIPENGEALRSIKPDFLFYADNSKDAVAVLDAKYKEIWGKAYNWLSEGRPNQTVISSTTEVDENEDDESDSDSDSRVYSESTPWKDSRIREDSFQVMSYMHVTHAKTGGILFPMVTKDPSLPIRTIKLYEGTDERFLLIPVCLPEDTGDFGSYCEEMDLRLALLREQLMQVISTQKQ